jgi:hypothetical protein
MGDPYKVDEIGNCGSKGGVTTVEGAALYTRRILEVWLFLSLL